MSKIEVDTIAPQSGTTVTLGESGDTVNIPSGVTLTNSGTATGFGISWQSDIKTSAFTAVAGEGYWINTTSAAVTVTLPASASVGDTIEFTDYARTWNTNNLTLNTNSLNYQGNSSPNPVYDVDGQHVRIVYSGATQGWIPTVDDDVTLETPQTYSADFLVIAGGGAGGTGTNSAYLRTGGGGGAGGYRNSYSTETSGGGGSSETNLTLTPGTVYTITVGAGGANAAFGNPGSDSLISGSDITTITSTGGGGGANWTNSGAAGGSGGGGGAANSATSGGSGTANQGFDGGGTPASGNVSGGGGGAGQVGEDAEGGAGGNGGDGVASSITGSSVTRAGGGGAGTYAADLTTGGAGGGGAGGYDPNIVGEDGTTNTGSGGGGGGEPGGIDSGSGGSGVVILRMATASYSGTTSGSPTVTTDGTDTILTFTGSGTYTG
jgi:hypothetical protein